MDAILKRKTLFMKSLSVLKHVLMVWSLLILVSCATSRPDLVWTEEGHQFGKASWYDDHGNRAANGEIYNMHAMTAAHPSLALNSIVEVTNIQNGKKVRVRVNDRLPPVHEGRIIDLSAAAFRRLAPLNRGLINVEIRVIQYGNNKYVQVDQSAEEGKIYLKSKKPCSVRKTL